MKARFINETLNEEYLSVQYLDWDPETKSFSGEISMLPNIRIQNTITLMNPQTGKTKQFHLYKTDYDGSGEDIYGWNYKSDDGLKLLIIND